MSNTPLDALQAIKTHIQALTAALSKQQDVLQLRGITLLPELFTLLDTLTADVDVVEKQLVNETNQLGLLRTLAGTSAQMNSSLDLDEVLAEAMERVITLTGAERGYIVLTDENPFELQWQVRIARDPEQVPGAPLEFQGSRTILREVLENGQALLTDNAYNDPRLGSNVTIAAMNLRSVLCVPLTFKARVIGAVYVDNRLRAGLFTPQEETLLTAFANQAAIAISNARLFARVQSSIDALAELKELMDNIFSSIGSGVITTGPAHHIVMCNLAAGRILDHEAQQVIGQPLPELMPESNADFAEYLQRVQTTNENQFFDVELARPNNGRLSLNIKISPLKDGNHLTQGAALVFNDLTQQRENEAMLSVMRRYLPPEMVDNIHTIAGLALGGERRETTCVFVDVRPLSTFPPDLLPQQIMDMLNRYLSVAAECIQTAGGVVDKYMGHEIMALFNSQLNPLADHAACALAAALDIRQAFVALYAEQGINPDPHYYRVGLHSGVATLGNVGSDIRRDFTAIGDAINLAKRLEESAQPGQIILSEDTRQQIAQSPGEHDFSTIHIVERDMLQVKGRQQQTRIYEAVPHQ
jgi:adenylate cyclase